MKFPEKCPYCGKDIVENPVSITPEKLSNGIIAGVRAEVHKCIHCNRYIYAFRSFIETDKHCVGNKNSIMYYYPVSKFVEYPERVKALSPSAYKIYRQTREASDYGPSSLLGAGLRMALEHLVCDYLVKNQGNPTEEIQKLTLANRIQKLNTDESSVVCAELIRIFGNDSIHITPLSDIETSDAFEYFSALLDCIDYELAKQERKMRLEKIKQDKISRK